MSHEMSDFAKSLLAAGRAEIDPEHPDLERALLARLEGSRSTEEAGAGAAHVSKGSLVRWLGGGVAVGIGALALLFAQAGHSPSPSTESPAESMAPVATAPVVRDAPPPTASIESLVAVTPASLPSAAPSTGRLTANVPPSDLLREANQLRAQSRWADAAKKYEQVLRQRPDSPEAYPATVALAKLALDHLADPRRALTLYDGATTMAPDGSLAEEAAWGRARALRALGRRDDERSALRSFLSSHPSSLLAGPAAERLKTLEAL